MTDLEALQATAEEFYPDDQFVARLIKRMRDLEATLAATERITKSRIVESETSADLRSRLSAAEAERDREQNLRVALTTQVGELQSRLDAVKALAEEWANEECDCSGFHSCDEGKHATDLTALLAGSTEGGEQG